MAVIDIQYGKTILADSDPENLHGEIKEMEMVLQNSSYGHEYAMMELQNTRGLWQQVEIQEKLEEYKQAYFQARRCLHRLHPERLRKLEEELAEQKIRIFKTYTA